MYIVIAYDITNNVNRNHLAKELFKFGIRTQKSVFECEINKKDLRAIKKIINKYSESDDFVTIYEIRDIERIGNVDYLEIDDLVF